MSSRAISESVAAKIMGFKTTEEEAKPQEETKPQEAAKPNHEVKLTMVGRPRYDANEEKRTERISLVVTPSLYDKIDKASRDKRKTKNDYIISVLESVLGGIKKC